MRCRPLEYAIAEAASHRRRDAVAVLRDVTERTQHEQAIKQARAEAERANDRKSRFVATMSRELMGHMRWRVDDHHRDHETALRTDTRANKRA
jgi:hypothetical protein